MYFQFYNYKLQITNYKLHQSLRHHCGATTSSYQQAFDKVKSMLTSDCVMSHFDPSVETQLKVDASPFGPGAILLQGSEGDERRYSQTEKEALAVVWACERFHIYLYGQ